MPCASHRVNSQLLFSLTLLLTQFQAISKNQNSRLWSKSWVHLCWLRRCELIEICGTNILDFELTLSSVWAQSVCNCLWSPSCDLGSPAEGQCLTQGEQLLHVPSAARSTPHTLRLGPDHTRTEVLSLAANQSHRGHWGQVPQSPGDNVRTIVLN